MGQLWRNPVKQTEKSTHSSSSVSINNSTPPQICLCLAASVHGFFGKLLATKKELTKSCRTEEVTTFSTEYSTECGHALRWKEQNFEQGWKDIWRRKRIKIKSCWFWNLSQRSLRQWVFGEMCWRAGSKVGRHYKSFCLVSISARYAIVCLYYSSENHHMFKVRRGMHWWSYQQARGLLQTRGLQSGSFASSTELPSLLAAHETLLSNRSGGKQSFQIFSWTTTSVTPITQDHCCSINATHDYATPYNNQAIPCNPILKVYRAIAYLQKVCRIDFFHVF